MKRVLAFSLFCLVALSLASCNIWGDDGKVPDGTLYYTDCPRWIYFVDENGNDRLDLDSLYNLPTAFQVQVPKSTRMSAVHDFQKVTYDDVEYIMYNNTTNFLRLDSESGLIAFQSYLWGKTPQKEFTTYMYHGDDEFTLKVTFQYLTQENDGVQWGVKITSVLLNDTEVFQGNEKGKVFVVKPSQGDISVRVDGM